MDASTTRFAAYAQDEWNVGKQWDFYAGLRWEGIETRSDSDAYQVSNLLAVFVNNSSIWNRQNNVFTRNAIFTIAITLVT